MLGHFEFPDTWSCRVEATFVEPDRLVAHDPRLLGRARASPSARLSIRRGPAESDTPAASLAEFTDFLVKEVPGIRIRERGAVTFDDGSVGAAATFQMENEGLTWTQRHLYRHDAGWVTHFTVTVTAEEQARLSGDLWKLVNAWRPPQAG